MLSRNKIIFCSNRDGNNDIYAMDTNGNHQVNLTNTPDLREYNPHWSPDGKNIVFNVNNDIFVMNNDGSNRIKLKHGGKYGNPIWSPDGKEIAFIRRVDDRRLCIMNSDSTNLRELTLVSFGGISWSADGNKLAITIANGVSQAIATINKNGTGLKILTPESLILGNNLWDEHPDWSPWPLK